MIPRTFPMRESEQDCFRRLIGYLLADQGKTNRVGEVRTANCHNGDPQWATAEICAVQNMHVRTNTKNKTYHFMVSFRREDKPTAEMIHGIENRMCEALGFGEHQRISVLHHDTDHLHLHVAVNKVHPVSKTVHSPAWDKYKLNETAAQLERDLGLAEDRHVGRNGEKRSKADDIEAHRGMESRIRLVREAILPEALAATSWLELHQLLAAKGFAIVPRGNGLVIVGKTGPMIKASNVSRQLAKPSLEKGLGKFEPRPNDLNIANIPMPERPTESYWNHSPLYDAYLRESETNAAALGRTLARLNEARKREIEEAIRFGRNTHELGEIRKKHKPRFDSAFKEFGKKSWRKWLQEEAKIRNIEALFVLRKGKRRLDGIWDITLSGETEAQAALENFEIDHVTASGVVVYRHGKDVIRDDGKYFAMDGDVSDECIAAAILAAQKRHGNLLELQGTDEFKARVLRITAEKRILINYKGIVLTTRQTLLCQVEAKKGKGVTRQ